MSGSRRPPSGSRRPEQRSDPIVIDDDDEEGFEIVGGSQPHSQASTSTTTRSRKEEEPTPLPTSEVAFRTLLPDRVQLEKERLAREQKRKEQQAEAEGPSSSRYVRTTPPHRDVDLGGRIPSALLDTRGASEAIVADRETRSLISAAMRNSGLGPHRDNPPSPARGLTGDTAQNRRIPSVPATVPVSSAPAASAQAQSSPSTNILWWENFPTASTSAANSSVATRTPTQHKDQHSPASPSRPPKIASPSRRLEARPPSRPSTAPRGLSYTAAASSSQANLDKRREGFDVEPVQKRNLSAVSVATGSSPPRKRARPLVNDSNEPSGSGFTGQVKDLPKPGLSILNPYAPVQPSDRFWYGTVKHSYNRYAAENEQGTCIASLVQPRGKISSSSGAVKSFSPANVSSFLSASKSKDLAVETRLEHLVASSYCTDYEWLVDEVIPTGKTWDEGGTCPEVTYFAHTSADKPKGIQPKIAGLPNWTIISPPYPSQQNAQSSSGSGFRQFQSNSSTGFQPWQGVMHCKFFILFYPDSHMRFILLSGNLVDYDWNRIENTAFVQDFPAFSAADLTSKDICESKSVKTPFGGELIKLLNALSLPKPHTARQRLEQYDLTGAVGSLVLSAPQRSPLTGWEQVEKWGVGRLGAVVRSTDAGVGLRPTRGGVDWEAQGSSLGDLRPRWLQHFHILASGVDPCGSTVPCIPLPTAVAKGNQRYADTLYPAPSAIVLVRPGVVPPPNARLSTNSGKASKDARPDLLAARPPPRQPGRVVNQAPADLNWPPVKICFPSLRWIKQDAIEGPRGAGTFFGKKKKFMEGKFKHLFHQPRSLRGDFLMHAKVLLALQPGYDLDDALVVVGGRSSGRTLGEDDRRQADPIARKKGNSANDSILISDSDDDLDDIGAVLQSSLEKQKKGKERDASTGSNGSQNASERRSPPAAIGWVYSGSHNFTPSAWGNLTEKNGLPSLSMSNWELGIVLPLYDARDKSAAASRGEFDLHAHISTLAKNIVPYSRPVQRYLSTDEPWDQTVPENRALMGVDEM